MRSDFARKNLATLWAVGRAKPDDPCVSEVSRRCKGVGKRGRGADVANLRNGGVVSSGDPAANRHAGRSHTADED
jgi:hypothetical protein